MSRRGREHREHVLPLSDTELVTDARLGSKAAFEAIMERYERLVYRVAFSYTHDRDDALDVTQDVFVTLFAKLHTYRGTGSFKGWLMQVTHRRCLNWRRGRRRDGQTEELSSDLDPAVEATQEGDVHRHEIRRLLGTAMEQLNPRQHQAVTLRYFEQWPLTDIAHALDCSEGNVKSLLFRGLRKLQQQLAGQGS